MTTPHDIVHQLNTQRQRDEQTQTMGELVAVLRQQAETAGRSQRAAWLLSLFSMIIAAGSLAVAIVAVAIN